MEVQVFFAAFNKVLANKGFAASPVPEKGRGFVF